MTPKQKELLEDEVIRCSPLTRQRIADVIREYQTEISDLKIELEQERVISDGLAETGKDYEELIAKVYDMCYDKSDVRKMIDNFYIEHEG